jgi:hypothetical protein
MPRRGRRRYNSTILDLGTRWRWVVRFTSRPLYPGERAHRYLLDRSMSGPQSRSGRYGEEKKLTPPGNLTPGRPARSLLLYRLSFSRLFIKLQQKFKMRWRLREDWIQGMTPTSSSSTYFDFPNNLSIQHNRNGAGWDYDADALAAGSNCSAGRWLCQQLTEQVGSSYNPSDFNSGGGRFEYRLGYQLPPLTFLVVFLSPPSKLRDRLKIRPRPILSTYFTIIVIR